MQLQVRVVVWGRQLFSLDIFQLYLHTLLRLSPADFEVLQSAHVGLEWHVEGANQLLWSRRQESNIDLPAPISPSLTSSYRHQNAGDRKIIIRKCGRSQGSRRPSGRSSHANHPGSSPSVQQKITPHIPHKKIGPPFFNFPPYFFKVADLRFNTFLDTKRAIRRCWRSLRALRMLPIDSPSNFTLNGMFDPHFRKRSLAKIQKISPVLNRDLNRISLTLSNQHSLISAYSPTLSNRFLLRLLPSMHNSTGKRCSVG